MSVVNGRIDPQYTSCGHGAWHQCSPCLFRSGAASRALHGVLRRIANAAISKGKPGPPRRGVVFPDRYHAEIITSPRQARHALSYVANNWRKHGEDLRAPMSGWTIDWFSSAAMFTGWAEYGDEPFLWRGPPTYEPLVVYQPRTWLLREG